jgi:hypothetical protein
MAADWQTLSEILDGQNVTMTFKGGLGGSTHLRVLFEEGNVTYDSIDERFRRLATSMPQSCERMVAARTHDL